MRGDGGGASDHLVGLLGSLVEGRRFIVAADVLVGAAALAVRLRELGAAGVLAVGGSRGTGEVDAEVERSAVVLGLSGSSIMDSVRRLEAALAAPPLELVAAADAFDPVRAAQVVVPIFASSEGVLDRRPFGGRRRVWRDLEDKTTVDALWDRAGVTRAPSAIVPAEISALRRAAGELDAGAGTVWVADNRLGWHGGGEYAHWVRDDDGADDAYLRLVDAADQVRVMPFLDGVPCSIHGWVIGDEVVTFRPCEMVVLRVVGRSKLRYAGASTAWRPRPDDADQMRAVARRVGALLRREVDYRGAFTIDGVMTADGFRPTELNPRFGIALALLGRGTGLPLFLLHCATVDHPELDWRPVDLERLVVDASAGTPIATAHTLVNEPVDEHREVAIRRDGAAYVVASDGDDADGSLVLGPASSGGFLRVAFDRFEVGPPVAPQAASAFALAREVFGLDLPAMEAAPDLRPA